MPASVHAKKQNSPSGVVGGSLHMPSRRDAGDWACATAGSQASTTRLRADLDRMSLRILAEIQRNRPFRAGQV